MAKPAVALVMALLIAQSLAAESDWTPLRSRDGVEIFTRSKHGSRYHEFLGTVTIRSSLARTAEMILNGERLGEWFAFTEATEPISGSPGELVIYVETSVPFPFENRDMVYRLSASHTEPGAAVIELAGLPGARERRARIQRIESADGRITLRESAQGTVVVFRFHCEPGGGLPVAIANGSMAELPLRSLIGLRALLEEH